MLIGPIVVCITVYIGKNYVFELSNALAFLKGALRGGHPHNARVEEEGQRTKMIENG